MVLDTGKSNLSGSTLTLNFTPATTIPAGTPFIIKWDNTGSNIVNPVFTNVTVSNVTNNSTVDGVLTFTGTYSPINIGSEGDNTKLYLGDGNTLYWPNSSMTIGAQRAYFQLLGTTAGATATVRSINLNFGDGETTKIDAQPIFNVQSSMSNVQSSWYSLDGRKFSDKPAAKGVYINNGRKVVIN